MRPQLLTGAGENQGGLIKATRLAESAAIAVAAAAHVMTTGMPRVRVSKRDLSTASSAAPRMKLLLVKPKTIACSGAIASISAASSTAGGSAMARTGASAMVGSIVPPGL